VLSSAEEEDFSKLFFPSLAKRDWGFPALDAGGGELVIIIQRTLSRGFQGRQ